KILGKDDLDFARALSRGGYTDLAEKVCTAIEKNRRDVPGDLLGAQSVRIDIQFEAAARETSPQKRKDRLIEILNAKNDFIRTHGDARESADLLETLPDLYRMIGESIATLLEKEEDPKAQSDLRAQGTTLFDEAESLLRK